jgi:hypothetical protein
VNNLQWQLHCCCMLACRQTLGVCCTVNASTVTQGIFGRAIHSRSVHAHRSDGPIQLICFPVSGLLKLSLISSGDTKCSCCCCCHINHACRGAAWSLPGDKRHQGLPSGALPQRLRKNNRQVIHQLLVVHGGLVYSQHWLNLTQ